MATVNTYLNFPRKTEEAFNFYKSVFGSEFTGGISRFTDIPPSDNMPPLKTFKNTKPEKGEIVLYRIGGI